MAATPAHDLQVTDLQVSELRTYHRNPRKGNTQVIAQSLVVNGMYRPIVVNAGTHTGRPLEVLAGNHTLMAARDLGWESVAAVTVDVDDDQAARIVAADNRTSDIGEYDDRLLLELLADLPDLDGTGYDPGDLEALEAAIAADNDPSKYDGVGQPGILAERFLIPPFTILDARQGWWRQQKKAWIALGIESGETREQAQTSGGLQESARAMGVSVPQGASVFDPVLCEIAYRWWCPPGGTVFDPFAGGSVRGIVAAQLGRHYVGIDLRAEQVEANRANAATVVHPGKPLPRWHTGDATTQHLVDGLPDTVDLVFSCPPYADLEVYSDDPRDLSTMPYPAFREAHAEAIRQACDRLAPDAFAVWVIGEARGKDGALYGLVPDAVRAFTDAGLAYVTEAVLVTTVANAAMRAARGFTATRALARTHQTVLVFCRGDKKRATQRLGDVDVSDALDEIEVDPTGPDDEPDD